MKAIWTALLFIFVTWKYVSAQTCAMLTSGIQRCYGMIDIKLPQENLNSVLNVAEDYLETCGKYDYVEFLFCYDSVLLSCPDFRTVNPLLMDSNSIRSMIFGLCDYKEEYEKGLECAIEKNEKFHLYLQNCFGLTHFTNALDAVASGNWTPFCQNLKEEENCVDTVLNAFNCGEDFLKAAIQFIYSIQPRVCIERRDQWAWVWKYGMDDSSTLMASTSLIMALLATLLLFK